MKEQFAIGGSGSSYIYGYCDANYKPNMTRAEAIKFVTTGMWSCASCGDGDGGGGTDCTKSDSCNHMHCASGVGVLTLCVCVCVCVSARLVACHGT